MAIDDPKAQGTPQIRARVEANADTRRGGDVRDAAEPEDRRVDLRLHGHGDASARATGSPSTTTRTPRSSSTSSRGDLVAELDGEPHDAAGRQRRCSIPINVRHRLVNDGRRGRVRSSSTSARSPRARSSATSTPSTDGGPGRRSRRR